MTEKRYKKLKWLWENETNDEETQDWRRELVGEDRELVDQWDHGFYLVPRSLYQNLNRRS